MRRRAEGFQRTIRSFITFISEQLVRLGDDLCCKIKGISKIFRTSCSVLRFLYGARSGSRGTRADLGVRPTLLRSCKPEMANATRGRFLMVAALYAVRRLENLRELRFCGAVILCAGPKLELVAVARSRAEA